MDEGAAMRGDNDKKYQKSLYRNLSQWYLTAKIPYEMACHSNWDTAVTADALLSDPSTALIKRKSSEILRRLNPLAPEFSFKF